MTKYVVAYRKKIDRANASWRAEVVDAHTPDGAATAALEGERWESEDGLYEVHVSVFDEEAAPLTVRRSTETTIEVQT